MNLNEKFKKLAKLLVDYSTEVKSGDRVIIATDIAAKDFALEVYRLCLIRGAHPFIWVELNGEKYIYYKYASIKQLKYFPEPVYHWIKNTDVYIGIRAPTNLRELSAIEPKKISIRTKILEPITDWRVEKTRWVVFYYPTPAMAQEAGMSLEEFENFVCSACLIDWKAMDKKLQKFKKILDKADKVKIISKDTNLEFSIKNRNAVVSIGKNNMPSGEVFTSVVENSANGHVYFDLPLAYMGNVIEGINLEFKNGRVVKYSAKIGNNFLRKILNTDKGSRRIGEFGIGLNYNIKRPTKIILFDEKIGGTIHLAIGKGYKETLSKNKSAIHWDMIKDLRKDGKVYFDEKLVMRNGKWLI